MKLAKVKSSLAECTYVGEGGALQTRPLSGAMSAVRRFANERSVDGPHQESSVCTVDFPGRSGLGIEAQWDAASRFATAEGFDLTAEFVEVETGKGPPMPWTGGLNSPQHSARGGLASVRSVELP